MKTLSMKKLKVIVLSCLLFLATFFGLAMWKLDSKTASANVTLNPDTYKTAGGSVRLFNDEGDVYSQRKGIRFHILLEKSLYETYSANENFVSYTVVLPKSILGTAELGYDTPKAVKINTTEYWQEYDKDTSFMESIAYIYDLPATKHATDLCFMGVFSTDGGSTWNKTDVGVKSMAYVAKAARDDANANWNDTQETALNYYIPKYQYTYQVGSAKTTETVEYGDTLNIPTLAENTSWWYEEGNGEVAPPTMATFENLGGAETTEIQLTSTTTSNFVLTGVEYTETGFKVWATLSAKNFGHGTTLTPENVDMVKGDGTVVEAKTVTVEVVNINENAATDAAKYADAKSQLVISFDYDQISNGDTLTILKSSQFYYNGCLYELGTDYTFEYNNANWQLPLGEIHLGDIATIVNYTEGPENDKEYNIRVTFRSDFLINGGATLEKADGCTKESSIYITRFSGGSVDYITTGYYYWNQGVNKILELPQTNDLWGEEDGDVLTIEAGTKLVQNNGYYVFAETITATYSGGVDWVFSFDEHNITAEEFKTASTRTEIDKDGNEQIYIDVTTNTRWADRTVKVVLNDGKLTYHNTDNVTELNPDKIYYHGETAANGTQYSLLRIYLDKMSVTGDRVTIPANTEFWVGDQIYRLTEEVISYYVYEPEIGSGQWITNPEFKDISGADILSMRFNTDDNGQTYSIRYTTKESWSDYGWNRVIVDDTFIDGEGVVCHGTNYSKFFYHGAGNNLFEIQGVNFGAAGGSVTIKAGTYLWLLNNSNLSFEGAYRVTEDLSISVSGSNGSPVYKDANLGTIYKSDIASFRHDGSHSGEIRISLNGALIQGVYGFADVDGTATLNGSATTSGFVYGYKEGVYTGNTILAFTGEDFGKAFQATAVGDKLSVAEGTKLWLRDGAGYVLIGDTWNYVWNGSTYVDREATYAVSFNVANAKVTVDSEEVTNVAVQAGDRVTFKITPNAGCELLSVTGATQNPDGSYTTDYIFSGTTVTVNAAAYIDLGLNCVSGISRYEEGVYTGVRINLNESAVAGLNNISGGHYGMAVSGEMSLLVGGVDANFDASGAFNYFGANHGSLLELRFDTTNLEAGDMFTIKAGTIFSHSNIPYKLRFTVDVMGIYNGAEWKPVLNPTKAGELNWSTINRIASYSDVINGTPQNYTIRMSLTAELFGGSTSYQVVVGGNVYLNGMAYTGAWAYHGNGNKILQLSNWNYEAGDVLEIEAGAKIYMGSSYYEVTETLTALCTANGNGATWNWVRESTPKLGEIDWSTVGNITSFSDLKDGVAQNYMIRIFLTEALFNGAQQNHTIFALDGVTLNGNAYVGTWTYHGGVNKILQIDTWNYKSGDVLVIAAGTKICTSTGYYEVTKTLTATCSADGTGATWNFTVS